MEAFLLRSDFWKGGRVDAIEVKATLVPFQVPFVAAAHLSQGDTQAGDEGFDSVALAVLDLEGAPRAAALFGSLLDIGADSYCRLAVEVWVPLAADEDPYAKKHESHPILRFLVGVGFEGDYVVPALAFLVCAECEPSFLSHVTYSDQLGVGSVLSEDVDPHCPSLLPIVLLATLDPIEVAYIELAAWRRSRGNWSD